MQANGHKDMAEWRQQWW